jgi:hypothetical protein
MSETRLARQTVLEAAETAETDPEAPMKLALLQNEIAEGDFQQHAEVPIELTDSEKTSTTKTGGHTVKGMLTVEASRASILSHPRAVHPIAAGQDEAEHRLQNRQHILRPTATLSAC